MLKSIIISILLIAFPASAGNMFFLVEKSVQYRTERVVTMEEYQLCADWDNTDKENHVCKEWVTSSRYKSHKDIQVPEEAYYIGDGKGEHRDVTGVKVGTYNGKDVVHIVSDDMNLKRHDEYLTDSFAKMKAISNDLHGGVYESTYSIPKDADGRTRVRMKANLPMLSVGAVKLEDSIPHKYFGVDIQ